MYFFKQKTANEMRISDWSSDVSSSDLRGRSLPRCVRLFSSRTYPKTIARRIGSRDEPVAFLLDSTTGLDVRLIVIKAASLGYCRGLCAGSPYSSRWSA